MKAVAWILAFKVAPALIISYAEKYNLDPAVVMAIVQTESSGGRSLTAYEPTFSWLVRPGEFAHALGISHMTEELHQKTSWGPMHIMGGTARDMGFNREIPLLVYPETGLEWGCKYLRFQASRFGDDPETLYAAYNGGSPRKTNGGMFENQDNVDNFMRWYRELTEID